MNVFTAVLSGLKGLNEAKTGFGQEDVKKSATNLIIVSIVITRIGTRVCFIIHAKL